MSDNAKPPKTIALGLPGLYEIALSLHQLPGRTWSFSLRSAHSQSRTRGPFAVSSVDPLLGDLVPYSSFAILLLFFVLLRHLCEAGDSHFRYYLPLCPPGRPVDLETSSAEDRHCPHLTWYHRAGAFPKPPLERRPPSRNRIEKFLVLLV